MRYINTEITCGIIASYSMIGLVRRIFSNRESLFLFIFWERDRIYPELRKSCGSKKSRKFSYPACEVDQQPKPSPNFYFMFL